METAMTTWHQFGLVGIMAGSVMGLLFLVIKWTLATTREILTQAATERVCWIKAMGEHTEQARAFHESVKEAHAYQRQEHQQMIEALGRINGYKH